MLAMTRVAIYLFERHFRVVPAKLTYLTVAVFEVKMPPIIILVDIMAVGLAAPTQVWPNIGTKVCDHEYAAVASPISVALSIYETT